MLDKALLDYDFAINLNPAYQNAWAAKGDAHMDNGQYEEAIIAYSKAITLSPNDAAALFNRGVCYAHQNIKDKALEDLRKAVQLNPEYKGLVSKNHILIELLTLDEFKSLTT